MSDCAALNHWLQILIALAVTVAAVLVINAVFDHMNNRRRNEILDRAFGPDKRNER